MNIDIEVFLAVAGAILGALMVLIKATWNVRGEVAKVTTALEVLGLRVDGAEKTLEHRKTSHHGLANIVQGLVGRVGSCEKDIASNARDTARMEQDHGRRLAGLAKRINESRS